MILKKVYFSTFLRFVVSVTLVSFAQTGGLLLEGDSIKYFGATIPINLAAAVIAEVILVRGAEFYRILTDYTQEERSTLWVLPMIPNSSSC